MGQPPLRPHVLLRIPLSHPHGRPRGASWAGADPQAAHLNLSPRRGLQEATALLGDKTLTSALPPKPMYRRRGET